MNAYLGIFLRGMMMGAADVVPGVSGGTIAFITGIYDRLLSAISAVDLHWARQVLTGRWREAFAAVDGIFLLSLGAGIVTSVATLAHLITWLLETHPVPLWAFFFGLIAGSAILLIRHVSDWGPRVVVALLFGIAVAALCALSPAVSLGGGALSLFFAGFLAICAMVLPGISGSFILVLLGMYGTVLGAVETLDVRALGLFACGAVCGLLVFARLLHWLLQRYHSTCMAMLTGFLAGSLLVVWPWKLPHGVAGNQVWPASPGQYTAVTGDAAQLLPVALLMFCGFALVWLIERRWGEPGL